MFCSLIDRPMDKKYTVDAHKNHTYILNSSRENPVSPQTWLTDRKTYGYFEYFSNKNGQKHYHIYNISVNLSVTEAELPIVLKSFFIKKI